MANQLQFEEEDDQQRRDDEQRLAEHAASLYRDWEQWVVLNTHTVPKRRRLVLTTTGEGQGAAAVTLPSTITRLDQLRFAVHVESYTEDRGLPDASFPGHGLAMDVNGPAYQKAYEAWRKGEISDAGVENIFGADILFLFQVNKEGIPGDTLQAPSSTTASGAKYGYCQLWETHS